MRGDQRRGLIGRTQPLQRSTDTIGANGNQVLEPRSALFQVSSNRLKVIAIIDDQINFSILDHIEVILDSPHGTKRRRNNSSE